MVMSRKIQEIICAAAGIAVLGILIIYPGYSADGVKDGIACCTDMLIPSLFPYMVLSSFLMRTGAAEKIGRFLGMPIGSAAFLPHECAAAVLLSLIGGFPVGAKCVFLLYERRVINEYQARRMMYYCVCPGPAFMITAIGCLLIGSPASGVLLYVSQLISALIIMFVTGLYARKTEKKIHSCEIRSDIKTVSIADSFILSVRDGAGAAASMCAMVLVFSMFIGVFEKTGLMSIISSKLSSAGVPGWLTCFIPGLLEVSLASKAVHDSTAALWVYSAVVGFGGLCVHFQILSISSGIRLKFGRFILARVVNAVLSSFITMVLCALFPVSVPAAAIAGGYEFELSAFSFVGSVVLLLLSAAFLLSFRVKKSGPV